MAGREHIPELDGLRGIAALMVVFHHMAQSYPGFSAQGTGAKLLHVWLRATTPGWMGVDVFFVLSGFLITGILLETKNRVHFYRNFYVKRILRIFPLYYLILLLMLLVFAHSRSYFVLCVFYLANFCSLFGIAMVVAPLWSLSVEEHFYLIWPWVAKFLPVRAFLGISLLICIVEPAFRFYAFRNGFFNPYFSWFRFDGLALGAIVAVLAGGAKRGYLKNLGAAACLLAAAIFCGSLPFGGGTRLTAVGTAFLYADVSLFTAGVVSLVVVLPRRRFFSLLRSRFLMLAGEISYCVYLIHTFVIAGFYWAATSVGRAGGLEEKPVLGYLMQMAIVLGVCFGIGLLSRDYFEGPIRRLRVRLQ
jgi:peptidoglycan/LPS O-acetylase OafA/YrhL